MLTRDSLQRMFPNAIPEWLDAMAELAPELCQFYRFNRLDWVHLCGQIAAETRGLSLARMEENMRFRTARRILEVYSYRLGVAIARKWRIDGRWFQDRATLAAYLVNKPKLLADVVYGDREGTPIMQGSKYLGRGPTQITHLNNYRAISEEIARQPGGEKFDLVANPEMLAEDPELGIRAAFADWHIKGLSRWAQADDCDTLSDALNTGNIKDSVKPHGLKERRAQTARAKLIWPKGLTFEAPAEVPSPEVAEVPPVKDLVNVSRKVRILVVARQALHSIWLSIVGLIGVEQIGVANGIINDVKTMVSNMALPATLVAVVCGILLIRYLIGRVAKDYSEGRYIPSGGQ